MAKSTVIGGKPSPGFVTKRGNIVRGGKRKKKGVEVDFDIFNAFVRSVQRGRKAVRDKAIRDSIEAIERGRR